MKKIIKRTSFITVIFGLVFLFSGCSGGSGFLDEAGTKTPTGEKGKWAIYWYCCGSDLESEYGAATADIEEMLGASLPNDVKVVVQTGGAASWDNSVISSNAIERYEYGSDGFNRVDTQPQASMGDPATLESFLSFCKTNYPAEHTMLIFWNHGGGSVSGVCFDENYSYDSLTLSELNGAMGSVYNDGSKLDIVGMDACLMATLDNANIMKNYANYMVASEETEPGNGWEYLGWLDALGSNPDMSPQDLGKTICDTFMSGCEDSGTKDQSTLSLTDLSKVDALVEAVDQMGTEVLSSVAQNTKVVGQFGRDARSAENYGGNNDEEGYTNLVDLGDLMTQIDDLIPNADTAVIQALNEAVVYKVNGEFRSKSSGLSTYYSYSGDPVEASEYATIAASPNYTRFMRYSLGEDVTADIQAETGLTNVQPIQAFSQDPTVTLDNDEYITMNLDPASLDSVSMVTFDLYYMDYDNNEILILGSDDDLDANWDTGEFKDNFRGVWAAIDGNYCYLDITYQGDDYNLYTVPILLNGSETNMTISYDFEKETYKILGVNGSIDENTGMASREMTKLQKGDQIILLSYAMSMDEGNDDEYVYKSDPIAYTDEKQCEEVELYDGEYAYSFTVTDTHGDTRTSNYAYITYENGEVSTSID